MNDAEALDELYLKLKGARERLCVAQTLIGQQARIPRAAGERLQVALDAVDSVGAFVPQWSRFDLPDVADPNAGT